MLGCENANACGQSMREVSSGLESDRMLQDNGVLSQHRFYNGGSLRFASQMVTISSMEVQTATRSRTTRSDALRKVLMQSTKGAASTRRAQHELDVAAHLEKRKLNRSDRETFIEQLKNMPPWERFVALGHQGSPPPAHAPP
jgi:hypothetical protein